MRDDSRDTQACSYCFNCFRSMLMGIECCVAVKCLLSHRVPCVLVLCDTLRCSDTRSRRSS